jgi:RPA family protein
MRTVRVLGVALSGLFVIGAVTAHRQINTRSQYGGTTAAVVDNKGNLRVPADYRTAYQMLGSWAVAADGPGSKQHQRDK